MQEPLFINRDLDPERVEHLQTLSGASALIERLRGGMVDRMTWNDCKNTLEYLVVGAPYFSFPIVGGLTVFRGLVIDEAETVHNISRLSYCPEEMVRSYGRCNQPNESIFYGANSLDAALSELKAMVGNTIYVAKANVKADSHFLLSEVGGLDYIRRYNRLRFGDADTKEKIENYLSGICHGHKNGRTRLELIDAFFADQFSKPFGNDHSYKLTSALANILLDGKTDSGEHTIHGFAYPSVSHNGGINYAILPCFFDEFFEWEMVFKLKILDVLGYGIFGKALISHGKVELSTGEIAWENATA